MDLALKNVIAEWKEWAAFNLSAGVSASKIQTELVDSGLPITEVSSLLKEIQSDPIFRAAERHAKETKKWTALMDGLMALEAQSKNSGRIPRRSNLSSEEFFEQYYCLNHPVILTDVLQNWPAYKKWDLDFLEKHYGKEMIQYQNDRNAGSFHRTFSNNKIEASLGDYIDLLRAGETTNNHYLIAHDRMLERPGFKGLVNDMSFDSRYFDKEDKDERLFFWLGPKGSMTHMHRDLGNVFFAQLMGRKEIKLVPAKHMHYIYNEVEYYSEVDFDLEDRSKYPLLDKATIIRDVIKPGELLLIPVGWWHFLKSLDVTISVTMTNFRYSNDLPKIF